jgi:DNA replication protein DnaC
VLFTTAIDMINHLIAAEADHSLLKQRQYSQLPDLLGCDELGSLSLGQQGSHLSFQVLRARHQHTSTVIPPTFPCADWGKVFDATPVATAIADRLVFNSAVLILGGESYRRKMT